jgi:anti-anti-sigma regulatory factor
MNIRCWRSSRCVTPGVLLAASDDAGRDGWSFAVTRGRAQVRRLIELVRFDRQLPPDGHP